MCATEATINRVVTFTNDVMLKSLYTYHQYYQHMMSAMTKAKVMMTIKLSSSPRLSIKIEEDINNNSNVALMTI